MALPNIWHLRQVAETSARPCDVCYKPSTNVLITPDQKDFFYICKSHLQGTSFATPIVDEAEQAAKKKREELDNEIKLIKEEYEEKLKKRKKSKKSEDKDGKTDQASGDDNNVEKEKDQKIEALNKQRDSAAGNGGPRVFALQKIFYQKRLDRLRNAEYAKKNVEYMKNTDAFPSAPRGSF